MHLKWLYGSLSLSKVVQFILHSFHLMEPLGLPIVKLWCNKVYRLCCRCYLCETPIACIKWKRLRYYCTLTQTITEKRREHFRVFLRAVTVRVFSRGVIVCNIEAEETIGKDFNQPTGELNCILDKVCSNVEQDQNQSFSAQIDPLPVWLANLYWVCTFLGEILKYLW